MLRSSSDNAFTLHGVTVGIIALCDVILLSFQHSDKMLKSDLFTTILNVSDPDKLKFFKITFASFRCSVGKYSQFVRG